MIFIAFTAGTKIEEALEEARHIAKHAFNCSRKDETVAFTFNGTLIIVDHCSILHRMVRDYHTATFLDWQTIGPRTVEEYPPYIANELARVEAENKAKYGR